MIFFEMNVFFGLNRSDWRKCFIAVFVCCLLQTATAQQTGLYIDSIRRQYNIPAVAFAVVTADAVLEMHVSGVQRMNTDFNAGINDRFHIGSNTKAITALVAALLVAEGKLKWNTRFPELFPELKRHSKNAYHDVTLQDLLSFRGKLPGYTYSFLHPAKEEIAGVDYEQQRYSLARYFLSRKPMRPVNGLTASNVDYILAGLMLEKAAGFSYKDLVLSFGKRNGISFGFDYPNQLDTLQPWGHDKMMHPLPPSDNYKLNWLQAAGNINISLPDYVKLMQIFLNGLQGRSSLLNQNTFNWLLYGLPVFSIGWFNRLEEPTNYHVAFNEGNAGAFISQVQVVREQNKAFIIFANAAADQTIEGLNIIMRELKKKYNESK